MSVWLLNTLATTRVPVLGCRILSFGGTAFVLLGGAAFRFRQASRVCTWVSKTSKLSQAHRVMIGPLDVHFLSSSRVPHYSSGENIYFVLVVHRDTSGLATPCSFSNISYLSQ